MAQVHDSRWTARPEGCGAGGSVGIWHETYVIGDGCAEALYGNMPRFGLAAATEHVPVTTATGTARKRLYARSDDRGHASAEAPEAA